MSSAVLRLLFVVEIEVLNVLHWRGRRPQRTVRTNIIVMHMPALNQNLRLLQSGKRLATQKLRRATDH